MDLSRKNERMKIPYMCPGCCIYIFVLYFIGKTPGDFANINFWENYLETCISAGGIWTSHGESCYYISTSTISYVSQAAIECSKLGGYLVEVETMEEHYQLTTDFKKTDEFWVGIEMNPAGEFVWITDKTVPVIPYVISNGHNTARYRYVDGTGWYIDDFGVPSDKQYICEKDKTYIRAISCDGNNEVDVDMSYKQTLQSSNQDNVNYLSSLATDNSASTCAITNVQTNPWWQIDLSQPVSIKNILFQLGMLLATEPTHHFVVKTFMNEPTILDHSNVVFTCGLIDTESQTSSVLIECTPHSIGRYLRIEMLTSAAALSLCDVRINAYTCSEEKTGNTCSADTKRDQYRFSYEPPVTVPSPSPCFNVPVNTSVEVVIPSTPVLQMSSSSEALIQSSFSSFDAISTSLPSSLSSTFSSISALSSSSYGYSSLNTEVHVSVTPVQTFEELIAKLRIDNKATNSYRRKLISAEDDRITSQYIGYVGIIILVVYLAMLLVIDFHRFYFFIRTSVRQR